jgi:hypothetical protein
MFRVSPERKLIVLHTPKCGGSSLKKTLTDAFGHNAVYADYKFIKGERTTLPDVIDKPIIYGHFPAKRYEAERDAYWATLLRHPVDRMLSMYFNWRHSPTKPLKNPIGPLRREVRQGKIGLLDFARQPQLNRLTKYYFADFDMARFNLIIAHEHYNAGVAKLGADLGVKLRIAYANVSSSRSEAYNIERKKVEADAKVMDELREILKPDIEFYDRAIALPTVVRTSDQPAQEQRRAVQVKKTAAEKENAKAARLAAKKEKRRALVARVKKEAESSGLNWREISKEQRRQMVLDAAG